MLAAVLAAVPADAAGSVTERVDAAMSGFFPDEELVPPLTPRWSIPASVDTLLAADGRVYVTDQGGAVAFDLATGRQLWATGTATPVATAYDSGLLFVRMRSHVVALDGATGVSRWERALDNVTSWDGGELVAADGVVYVGDPRDVRALRAADGAELWRQPGEAPGTGAVDEQRLYVMGGCGQTYAYDRQTGEIAWYAESQCSGAHRLYPAVHAGRVWAPDRRYVENRSVNPAVYDAETGAQVGEFPGGLPVFVDGLAVLSWGSELHALDATTLAPRWRSDGELDPLIAVGHDVYGIRGGRLTAVSAEDGRVLWQRGAVPGQGIGRLLAAAPGTLLVAYSDRLTAYESFFKPAPRRVALGAEDTDADAGQSITLTGVLGRELRGVGVMVRVEAADWPREPFERFDDVRAARDGGFTAEAVVYRNSLFRVGAPGEGSDVVTVYAAPKVVIGVPRGGIATVGVRAPRTRLAGRTLFLYRDRPGNRPLQRLASGRLRATGPGRTRTRVSLRNRRGEIVFCIRGQLRLGLGRPTPLTRRCGARRISDAS